MKHPQEMTTWSTRFGAGFTVNLHTNSAIAFQLQPQIGYDLFYTPIPNNQQNWLFEIKLGMGIISSEWKKKAN